jgi:hypothetical protein
LGFAQLQDRGAFRRLTARIAFRGLVVK